MKFEYLSLADAANNGPDGKLNVLGLGPRVLNLAALPGGVPLAIIGGVSAGIEEAGEYGLDLRLIEPDGTDVPLVSARALVPSDVQDTRAPTGAGFVVAWFGPFRLEGLHRIHAQFGQATADYEFVVRLVRPESPLTP